MQIMTNQSLVYKHKSDLTVKLSTCDWVNGLAVYQAALNDTDTSDVISHKRQQPQHT